MFDMFWQKSSFRQKGEFGLMSYQSMMFAQVSPPCSINRYCFILYVSSSLFHMIYFQTLLITIDDFRFFFCLKVVSSISTILCFFFVCFTNISFMFTQLSYFLSIFLSLVSIFSSNLNWKIHMVKCSHIVFI